MNAEFESTLQTQLTRIANDIGELKDIVHGRPNVGWQGVLTRVDSHEKRITDLQRIQNQFIEDRKRADAAQQRKDRTRDRIAVAAIAGVFATLSGIVVLIIQLLSSGVVS